MTTFSTSLKLELIGDGQQSGTWGQTTNKNLGTLLEQAITGVQSITMVDTNYTLTSLNGVADEARNAVIVVFGTNSAQRNIIAPLVEKIYTISNQTTGGYGVQIIGSSGLGVVIANGTTTSVYCDGTNFYPLQTGSAGNQVINGNLSVTGTTSLTGALSGSTAAFSGAISSVSPAFTGTPTAPTAPVGTNTTQIATTAFVTNVTAALGTMSTQNANNVNITGGNIAGVALSSTVSWACLPAGTVVAFAQAAAPTGWTQVTSDSANNRMLRVVNTTGGGVGGTASPILNNVVPSHTHTYSGTSSGQSQSHTHGVSATTGGMSANASHSHGVTDPTHTHSYPLNASAGGGGAFNGRSASSDYPIYGTATVNASATGISINSANIDHTHSFSTTSGAASVDHTHSYSGTTDNGSSQTNWTPRYIDMIICSKN